MAEILDGNNDWMEKESTKLQEMARLNMELTIEVIRLNAELDAQKAENSLLKRKLSVYDSLT
jgi:hypothetical protein